MIRTLALVAALIVAVPAGSNPASFTCDLHYQTFIRQGSITRYGRCYEVYTHALPLHRVELPCQ